MKKVLCPIGAIALYIASAATSEAQADPLAQLDEEYHACLRNSSSEEAKRRCYDAFAKQYYPKCVESADQTSSPALRKLVMKEYCNEAAPAGRKFSRRKTATLPSLCDTLPGTWEWFANGDVTILPNGTAIQRASGVTANWSCNNRTVVLYWSHGFADHLTLSTDGNHLTGSNGITAVWGNRR